ncbi:MAG: NAD(P)H-dependent glycerol-3-phosphate dehydrogenase [Rhodocyclaceae bacterium]
MRVAVLGAGAWGTALALAFCGGHEVSLWEWEVDQARELLRSRENRRFLPGYPLPDKLDVHSDIAAAAGPADLLIIATPVVGLRPTLKLLRVCSCGTPILFACKGLESSTGLLPHSVVEEVLGAAQLCAALSGPSFADEVAKGLPTAVTVASTDLDFARRTVAALNSPRLRLYANDDIVGVEVGGAVKNVLAIAAGIADGMGFGLNARAALLTRGLAEIARLGLALGGKHQTFMGLAGMGDLILTCTGDLSRNRQVGLALAAGKSLQTILAELGHIAEGVNTAREVARRATDLDIDMPITQAVKGILFDDVPAKQAVEQLLARDPKVE